MAGGDEEFYVSYFQEPGRAEAEIEPDVRGWLRGLLRSPPATDAFDGRASSPGRAAVPTASPRPARCPPGSPRTTSTSTRREFERTGFTGALNRYRNVDRDWEDLAALDGAPIRSRRSSSAASWTPRRPGWPTPSPPTRTTLPGLVSPHILDGGGHWIQQERPDEVNRLLIDWLRVAVPGGG